MDMNGRTSQDANGSEVEAVADALCVQGSRINNEPDAADSELDNANPDAIVPRIDRHLVPILVLSVAMVSGEKATFTYVPYPDALLTIVSDLAQSLEEGSIVNYAFAARMLIAIPYGVLLARISAARWLGINLILWGIFTACTAAAVHYNALLALRIFAAIFESAVIPSVITIVANWYHTAEYGPRIAFCYCGIFVGQNAGDILIWVFGKVHSSGIQGWQITELTVGLVTIILGIICITIVSSSPSKARLGSAEKTAMMNRLFNKRKDYINEWPSLKDFGLFSDILFWECVAIATLFAAAIATHADTFTLSADLGREAGGQGQFQLDTIKLLLCLAVGHAIAITGKRWLLVIVLACIALVGLIIFKSTSRFGLVIFAAILFQSIWAVPLIVLDQAAVHFEKPVSRAVTLSLIASLLEMRFISSRRWPYQNLAIIFLVIGIVVCSVGLWLQSYVRARQQRKKRAEVDVIEMEDRGHVVG